ncbi:MAG: PCRF domain-containing protein, partial [Oscillospiraceae bacterium]|nr:PCRF domain-containing protein [Oscillospiraceae bacterium]
MIDKLREIANHFDQLQQELSDPEVYADPDRMRRLNREVHELTPLVETYREYSRYEDNLAQAEVMLSDPEMKEMAQEDIADARENL